MKQLFFLCTLLPGFLVGFGQNFNPFPSGFTYQFEYGGGDSLYVIGWTLPLL